MNGEYKICTQCIMDTTDPNIIFDDLGVCDHCVGFEKNIKPNWHTGPKAAEQLAALSNGIRKGSRNSAFDCIQVRSQS